MENDKPKTKADYIGRWCEAIEAARLEEKCWRDEADKAVSAFRGDEDAEVKAFNLYHSNIEILVPAIFNSTPEPDVRRRYGDSDPAGKVVSDMLERGLSYEADQYDFEGTERQAVYDMAVAGRGVTRVRYEPTVEDEKITSQGVTCEYVPWQRFIRGPAAVWKDVPWIAFEHFLPREEVEKLNPDLVKEVPFNYSAKGKTEDDTNKDGETPKESLCAHIFEIWDRRTRKITFLCPEFKKDVLAEADDPLKFRDFFPLAQPLQGIATVGGLTPVCPLTIYRSLLKELNDVTKRISKLVRQLRPRGAYAGSMPDMKALAEADDGELVSITAVDQALSATGVAIDKMIGWFPLESTVLALRELLLQRDAIKQTIYEVTGLADIMRGSTDPNETASAQKLKAQFGSVRVRSLQSEVARHARDTFRLKAEIIARFYEPRILMEMTGIKLLPQADKQLAMQLAQQNPEKAQQIAQQQPELVQAVQAPSIEEVWGIMRSDKIRSYRIDIETDSTIRADLMRAQEQMTAFLQGTAQFIAAVGPAVKEGMFPAQAGIELYAAFARQFNLGKAAEDALDKLSQQSQNMKPGDPSQAEAQKAGIEAQSAEKIEAAKLQQKAQSEEMDRQNTRQIEEMKAQIEAMKLQMKQYEIDKKSENDRIKNAQMAQVARDNNMQRNAIAAQSAQSKSENDKAALKQKAAAN